MASYSGSDKFLHKVYLGNYALSKAGLELEEILHGRQAKELTVNEKVFVTGLARSGTTAVMNKIFETGEYASLQYSNMPFVLNPNLWKRKSKIESHERAHKDGIIIDGNSPEEFDEYFWKSHLKDSYILEDGLSLHEVEKEILDKYLTYVKLICLSKGKTKYVSKNNNNILRLEALRKIDKSKIILLFRDPLAHASSLMKLHLRFSAEQKEDPFQLQYFDYLGHHEFGLHHKPFLLTSDFEHNRKKFKKDHIDYWLAIWLNYYHFLLNSMKDGDILICFEDLIAEPNRIYDQLAGQLSLEGDFSDTPKHNPSKYPEKDCDTQLLAQCRAVYKKLRDKKL